MCITFLPNWVCRIACKRSGRHTSLACSMKKHTEGLLKMKPSIGLENQLLATKFYAPVASGPLVARPRLDALLSESLKYPLTLVSAPAGFGKTTVLSTW